MHTFLRRMKMKLNSLAVLLGGTDLPHDPAIPPIYPKGLKIGTQHTSTIYNSHKLETGLLAPPGRPKSCLII